MGNNPVQEYLDFFGSWDATDAKTLLSVDASGRGSGLFLGNAIFPPLGSFAVLSSLYFHVFRYFKKNLSLISVLMWSLRVGHSHFIMDLSLKSFPSPAENLELDYF